MKNIICTIIITSLCFSATYAQNIAESNIVTYNLNLLKRSSESSNTYYKLSKFTSTQEISPTERYQIIGENFLFSESPTLFFKIGVNKVTSTDSKSLTNESNTMYIPISKESNKNTYALIIGNEDYASYQTGLSYEQNVEYALNDARLFREICNKTLGVPSENIIFLENATFVKTKQAITQIELICKHASIKPSLLFYYSGHGLPDELTKVPYIIPVDASGSNLEFGISLSELYKSLTKYPTEKAIVILDACFTGGARNSGLVASRTVRVRPKHDNLNGNLVVFSASSEDQPSKSYKDKEHGLFTYYFTSKIIEKGGDVTLGELDEFVRSNVPVKSILINKSEQVPQTNISSGIIDEWKNWTLK